MERTCTTPGCGKRHVAKGLCSTCYNRKNYTNEQRHKPQLVECSVCGKPFESRSARKNRKVCSNECRWFYQGPLSCPLPESHPAHPRWEGRLLPVPWVAPHPKAAPVPRSSWVWVAGYCAQCAAPFLDRQPLARFCSPLCGKRYWRKRTKLTSGITDATRRYVLARDGWRCQICKRMIRKRARSPHPLSASIDHVVPRSQGGSHDAANLRAAHFQCNSLRGDRGGGEQLALFG